jgi:hypothetical protein
VRAAALGLLLAALGCDPAPPPAAPPAAPPPPPAATVSARMDVSRMFSEVALADPAGAPLAPCLIFDDLDGDQRPDLLVLPTANDGQEAGRAVVYRNDGGGFSRHEVAFGPVRFPQGCAAGDYDGDGRLDVFVAGAHNGRMLRNRGGLRFEDVTAAVGIPDSGETRGRAPAFVDYDGDGRPDLYLGRVGPGDGPFACAAVDRGDDYVCHRPDGESGGAPALLLRNVGGARFEPVAGAAGAQNDAAPQSVAVLDWDLDGRSDLVVSNDFGANRVYLNRAGAFVDAAPRLGVDLYNHGMGTACADFAGAGAWDLFVADYGPSQLWLHAGEALMLDRGYESGVSLATRADSSWAPLAADFDQDGRVDLFVASSASMADEADLQPGPNGVLRSSVPQRDLFFFNRGPGPVFDVGAWPHAEGTGVGFSMAATAAADFDGDGDVDLAEVYGAWPRLVLRVLRNDVAAPGHWLQVRAGEGATVTLEAGGRRQRRSLTRSTGSLGGSSPVGHFGLGAATRVDWLTVVWPGGRREVVLGPLAADRVVTLAPAP